MECRVALSQWPLFHEVASAMAHVRSQQQLYAFEKHCGVQSTPDLQAPHIDKVIIRELYSESLSRLAANLPTPGP